MTCCAERNAIFAMVAGGEREIKEILVITDSEECVAPCGACRQVIAEFAPPSTVVRMYGGTGASRETTVSELLPLVFHLKKAPGRGPTLTRRGAK